MLECEERKNANSSQPRGRPVHVCKTCAIPPIICNSLPSTSHQLSDNDFVAFTLIVSSQFTGTEGYFLVLDSAHMCSKGDTRQAHACLVARRLAFDVNVKQNDTTDKHIG